MPSSSIGHRAGFRTPEGGGARRGEGLGGAEGVEEGVVAAALGGVLVRHAQLPHADLAPFLDREVPMTLREVFAYLLAREER